MAQQRDDPLFTPPTIDELAASWKDQSLLVLEGVTVRDMTVIITGLDRCIEYDGRSRYINITALGVSEGAPAHVRFLRSETEMRQLG